MSFDLKIMAEKLQVSESRREKIMTKIALVMQEDYAKLLDE